MLYTIIGMLVIILDQGVKMYVDKIINYTNTSIPLIPNVLTLVRVQNDGAAFSFLAGGGARIWFIALTLIFTLVVVLALVTNFISGKFGRWCMVLVTAGGLSNCLDRVLYGFVIDMFKIELFDFAVFNVADIFITVFCIAFIIYILFGGEKETDPDEEDEFDEDEEEEDRPKRVKKARKDKYADLYEEDEDEEEVYSRRRSGKKSRASYDEEDFEDDYKPVKASRSRKPSYDEDDKEYQPKRRASKKPTFEDDGQFEEMFGGKSSGKSEKTSKRSESRNNVQRDYDDEPVSSSRKAAPVKSAKATPADIGRSGSRRSAETPSDYDDPFAEWERANAAVRGNYSAPDQEVAPARKPFRKTVEEVANENGFNYGDDLITHSAPKAAAKPVSDDFDDFDLDSILNEFK